MSPLLLAGLLYLGSGFGLTAIRLIRDRGWKAPGVSRAEWGWLFGAISAGGIAGPVLLMAGLAHTAASKGALLLNLEAVLTAVLAWLVFQENADRRIVLGMMLIVAGGLMLALPKGSLAGATGLSGPILVTAACFAWAIDNNLTCKVATGDALFLAGIKGLVAGPVNLTLALVTGTGWPAIGVAGPVMLIGLLGYGVSLVLFVLALRGLGAARMGAYFSTAPFIGAVMAILMLGESTSAAFWLASALMAAGVWLHLTERHEHEHVHEAIEHSHRHAHDAHHQHTHEFNWDGTEPHTHPHYHPPLTHAHAHYPDIHHRHRHCRSWTRFPIDIHVIRSVWHAPRGWLLRRRFYHAYCVDRPLKDYQQQNSCFRLSRLTPVASR